MVRTATDTTCDYIHCVTHSVAPRVVLVQTRTTMLLITARHLSPRHARPSLLCLPTLTPPAPPALPVIIAGHDRKRPLLVWQQQYYFTGRTSITSQTALAYQLCTYQIVRRLGEINIANFTLAGNMRQGWNADALQLID